MSFEVARGGEYRGEVFPHGPVAKKVDPWKRPPTSLERMDAIEEHGTHRGYEAGCRGSHCPGVDLVGMSCAQAKIRYQGDMSYRRRVDGGLSAEAIWAENLLDGVKPPKVTTRDTRAVDVWNQEQTTVADLDDDFNDDAESVPALAVAVVGPLPSPQRRDVSPAVAEPAAPRTRKWAVRKVWVAIAPDGSLHGPYGEHMDAVAFVGEQLAPALRKAVAASTPTLSKKTGKPKRERRTWTDGDSETMLSLQSEGLSAAEIGRRMGRLHSVIVQRLRMAGLEPNGKRVDA